MTLIGEQQTRPAPPSGHQLARNRSNHGAAASSHHKPAEPDSMSRPSPLSSWLEGTGRSAIHRPLSRMPGKKKLIAKLREGDVVVSVPTGSGKTYVAVEAARRAIAENRTVIYTSPLKALSNTKYHRICRIFWCRAGRHFDRRSARQWASAAADHDDGDLKELFYDAGAARSTCGWIR